LMGGVARTGALLPETCQLLHAFDDIHKLE
jgi:hypothetical protein